MSSSMSEKEDKESREFTSAVLTGTVIGRTLQDALQYLVEAGDNEDREARHSRSHAKASTTAEQEANRAGDDEEGDIHHGDSHAGPPVSEVLQKLPTVRMNSYTMGKILGSFEEGIAETKLRHKQQQQQYQKQQQPDNNNNNTPQAPLALLRGRCDYFNRYGRNWMISMDKVRLKERPTKFTKRRRNDRPSLWDRDGDGASAHGEENGDGAARAPNKEIVVGETIQLLAYGDL